MKKGVRGDTYKPYNYTGKFKIFLGVIIILIVAFGALFLVYKYGVKYGLAGKATEVLGAVEMPNTFNDLKAGNLYNFSYEGKTYTLVVESLSEDKKSVGVDMVKEGAVYTKETEPITKAETLPPSLSLSMSFDERDVNNVVKDNSGNNNDCTNFSATWNSIGGYDGKGVYEFDGVNDYISCANSSSLNSFGTGGITVSAWVYVKGNPNLPFPAIVDKSTGDFTDRPLNQKGIFLSVGFYTNPLRDIRWAIGNGSTYNVVDFPISNDNLVGKWYHVVGTVDDQSATSPKLKLYLNGAEVGSASRTIKGSIDVTTKRLFIGIWSTFGRYFNGIIDDVKIYNKALTQEEINSLFNAKKPQLITTN